MVNCEKRSSTGEFFINARTELIILVSQDYENIKFPG